MINIDLASINRSRLNKLSKMCWLLNQVFHTAIIFLSNLTYTHTNAHTHAHTHAHIHTHAHKVREEEGDANTLTLFNL